MTGHWKAFSFQAPFDSYADWACDPGHRFPPDYEMSEGLHILISLKDDATLGEFLERVEELQVNKGGLREDLQGFRFQLSFLYTGELTPGYKRRQQFPALANESFLRLLQHDVGETPEKRGLQQMTDRFILSQKLPQDALCPSDSRLPFQMSLEPDQHAKDPEQICVVGIIDEGIAFANERFRKDVCQSRVEYVWIQDAACDCDGGNSKVGYGRELKKEDIDDLLRRHRHGDLVDEDALYREAGLADFGRIGHKATAWRTSHGAHVMDLACGFDMGETPYIIKEGKNGPAKIEQEWPIICVQLPSVMIADTSGLGLEKYMVEGLDYIFSRANEIANNMKPKVNHVPVVVNFSSGVRAGPHDGSHPVELAIDKMVRERRRGVKNGVQQTRGAPTEVVLPSGNSHLARIHAKVNLEPKGATEQLDATLTWRVQPDDRTFSFLEIWMPPGLDTACCPQLEITICPPGAEPSPPLGDTKDRCGFAWDTAGGETLCKISYEKGRSPTERGRYLVALVPTAMPDIPPDFTNPPKELAPSGDWTIRIRNLSNKLVEGIEAWIHWDESPYGYRRNGRQSYFIDPCYERFDPVTGEVNEADNSASVVRREGNISGIATGEETIVVGGYMRKELKAASYSSGGPIVKKRRRPEAHRTGPDAMAVCEESGALSGILAAGTRSGTVVALNGTSVAAPQVTRKLARELADGKDNGRRIVQHESNRHEQRIRHHETHHARPRPPGALRKGCGRFMFEEIHDSQGCRKPE